MEINENTNLDQAWQEAKYITLWKLAFCYVYGKGSAEFAEWLWDGWENCLFCDTSFEEKVRTRPDIDRCDGFCRVEDLCVKWRNERDDNYKFLPDIIKYYFNCLLETEV